MNKIFASFNFIYIVMAVVIAILSFGDMKFLPPKTFLGTIVNPNDAFIEFLINFLLLIF